MTSVPTANLNHYSYRLADYKARHFDVWSCNFNEAIEPVSAKFVVRSSFGRRVRTMVTNDFWYTNHACGSEDNGTIWDAPWFWDGRNGAGGLVGDGTYRTMAT